MVSVDAPAGGEAGVTASETVRALAYPALTGKPVPGDRVLLNTTALHQGLGTGGYALVVAIPDRLPPDPGLHGHMVKARYTPLQATVASVDEQDSPWHSLLRDADSLDGMPVVVADLHSALPAVLAGLRHQCRAGNLATGNVAAGTAQPPAVAYVMQDGGALPAWFSRTVAGLRSAGWLAGTVTTGQSFGGDLEAVTVHSGLLAARHVLGADMAIVTQGPGEPGHRDPLGLLRRRGGRGRQRGGRAGRPPGRELRISFADQRERHQGMSHHSLTAYGRVALATADVIVPRLPGEQGSGWSRRRRPGRTAPARRRGRGRPDGGAARLPGGPVHHGPKPRRGPALFPVLRRRGPPRCRASFLNHDRVRLTGK